MPNASREPAGVSQSNALIVHLNLARPSINLVNPRMKRVGRLPGDGPSGSGSPSFFPAIVKGGSVDAITDGVREIISRELKIPIEGLAPDTKLRDIGVTSLDLIFIVFALEERFSVSIPYNANETAAADETASSKVGLGKLESIAQISAALKELMGVEA